MARIRFEDANVVLVDKKQDLRGRELRDGVGRKLGEIQSMYVDTDTEHIVSVRTNEGQEYPVRDLQIMEGAVYYVPPEGAIDEAAAREASEARALRGTALAPMPTQERLAPQTPVPPPAGAAPIAAPVVGAAVPSSAGDADDYREHFGSTYNDSGLDFSDLDPAYRFGYEASAFDTRFGGRDFDAVEADLRTAYYERYGYPSGDRIVWNRIRDAGRHGYERAHTTG